MESVVKAGAEHGVTIRAMTSGFSEPPTSRSKRRLRDAVDAAEHRMQGPLQGSVEGKRLRRVVPAGSPSPPPPSPPGAGTAASGSSDSEAATARLDAGAQGGGAEGAAVATPSSAAAAAGEPLAQPSSTSPAESLRPERPAE
jgi:hypothetical protein